MRSSVEKGDDLGWNMSLIAHLSVRNCSEMVLDLFSPLVQQKMELSVLIILNFGGLQDLLVC